MSNKNPKSKFLRALIRIKNSTIEYTRNHYIIGGKRLSLFEFFTFFWTGIRNESIGIRGSSLAFKLFLSLFPALIFFVTLLPYISSGQFQEAFLNTLQDIMPIYAYKTFENTLTDFLYNPKFGLLSVVFVLSLVYSISNMNSILSIFNKSYYLADNRSFLKKRIVSLILTLLFFFLIILSMFFISLNKSLISFISIKQSSFSLILITALQYGRWIILFFIMLTWLSLLYTIGPPHKIKFRYFSLGSVFSSIFFILLAIAFNFFIVYFSEYNKIYGTLGVILVFFIWLYYISVILLIGFEINASLYIAPMEKDKSDSEDNFLNKIVKKMKFIPDFLDKVYSHFFN